MTVCMQKEMQGFGTSAPAAVEGLYSTSSTVRSRPLNCTVSPAQAPSIASKIGAIVEMPMSSRPPTGKLAR